MLDQLPFHIHEEIMKRLTLKLLIRFRSVSKSWKSLIDSAEFIAAHSIRHTQPHHLFVRYTDQQEDKYVSFVDDDSFPQIRFVPTLPLSLRLPTLVGSSYGLLCFDGYELSRSNYRKRMVVLLNPSIRKSIKIAVPDMLLTRHNVVLGFGVCPVTIDPKIVQIKQISSWTDTKNDIGNFWEVMVYMLSSGECRRLSSNLPSISTHIKRPQVVIDGFIYWCAVECDLTIDNVLQTRNLIMSFDLTNENFEAVEVPDSLAIIPPSQFSISKLKESLVILEYNKDEYDIYNEEQLCCTVWMMEHGVERSFTKLFTIKAPGDSISVLGFRKNGGPIMTVQDYIFQSPTELVVYEPNSELSNHLICGSLFNVVFYNETLVLLGRSDCSSY